MIIPVLMGRPRGNDASDFVCRPPVVAVRVASDTNWSPSLGTIPAHSQSVYYAMLDTGAENTAIDVAVANEINAIPTKSANLHGMGITTNIKLAAIQIILGTAPIIFSAHAALIDLRSQGQTFDLILGRSFLEHCNFSCAGPHSRYTLEWSV